jgi:hypothetical protein
MQGRSHCGAFARVPLTAETFNFGRRATFGDRIGNSYIRQLRERYAELSRRERDVMRLIVSLWTARIEEEVAGVEDVFIHPTGNDLAAVVDRECLNELQQRMKSIVGTDQRVEVRWQTVAPHSGDLIEQASVAVVGWRGTDDDGLRVHAARGSASSVRKQAEHRDLALVPDVRSNETVEASAEPCIGEDLASIVDIGGRSNRRLLAPAAAA